MKCASIRKRGSTDQCGAPPLRGHTLCGRHARMKSPTLWSDQYAHKKPGVVRIQACVRGWLVRTRMTLGGPGILRRKDVMNDEDLVTYDEKDKVHPMDYFAFIENDKIWWFRFDTIYKWCLQQAEPTNPYTKTPLQTETRKRIRRIWDYKRRHREQLPEESQNVEERRRGRWNIICQLFEDNGFGNINPMTFHRLKRQDFIAIFRMLHDDIETLMKDTDTNKSRLLHFCERGVFFANTNSHRISCPFVLMCILTRPQDSYVISFAVLSALYRC